MSSLKLFWIIIKDVWNLPPEKRKGLNKAIWRYLLGERRAEGEK